MKMMITLTYTMYIKQHDEYVRKKNYSFDLYIMYYH